MCARWHRLPLRFEVRKGIPGGLQSVFSLLLRRPGVSAEEDMVDFEHTVIRRVWSGQILPLLECDGRIEAFWFRTEVDGGLVVTFHAKDSRAAQSASASVASDGAVSGVLVSGVESSWRVGNVLNRDSLYLGYDHRCIKPRVPRKKCGE